MQINANPVATANLKLKSNLIERSCEVAGDSRDLNINLQTWYTNDMQNLGDRTRSIPFSITLVNCRAENVSITFKGQANKADSSLLALDESSTARNIAIELIDNNNKRLAIGQSSGNVKVSGIENPILHFFANYIATSSAITAGSANATANFVLNYD